MMAAYICDAIRTPVGRYGGCLSGIRTDDLAALPLRWLMERHAALDWAEKNRGRHAARGVAALQVRNTDASGISSSPS